MAFWKRERWRRLRKKISWLKAEEKSLFRLVKKVQEERFQKGTLPESLYKIRTNAYSQRLARVREALPVLEAQLKGRKKRRQTLFTVLREAGERLHLPI